MSKPYPASLGTYGKQPTEVVPAGRWGIDFDPDCGTSETISTATVAVSTVAGDASPLVAGSAAINGTKVSAQITGGSDGNKYTVTITAVSSASATYVGDFTVEVVDVD